MNKSCIWMPTAINNKTGEEIESPLYKELLLYTNNNRSVSNKLFYAIKSEDFRNKYRLSLNEFNEVNISDILKIKDINKFISEENVLNVLNKKIGTEFKKVEFSERNNIVKNIININESSEVLGNNHIAILDSNSDGEIRIKVVKKDTNSLKKYNQMKANTQLNDYIAEMLQNNGISIIPMFEYEEKIASGITDFTTSDELANNIKTTIKLAKNELGVSALPEEFAHVVLRSLQDDSLVQRFINSIDENTAKNVLGDSYEDYIDTYLNFEDIQEEVAGRILANVLINNTEIDSNIANRAIAKIKEKYSDLDDLSLDAKQRELRNLAFNIIEKVDRERNLDIRPNPKKSSSLYQLKSKEEAMSKLAIRYKDFRDSEKRKIDVQKRTKTSKKKDKTFLENQQKLIDEMQANIAKGTVIEGISKYNQKTLALLQILESKLDTVSKATYSEEFDDIAAKTLRDIRNLTLSYSKDYNNLIDTLEEIHEEDSEFLNDTDYKILHDTTKEILSKLSELNNRYMRYAKKLFLKKLKPLIDEYNEHMPLKKRISEDTILEYINKDLSFIDRWGYAAQDSNNHLIRMFEQIKKEAQNEAKLDTLEMVKELHAAAEEYFQAGGKDFEFLYNKNKYGKKTGWIYDKYDWSSFYKERQQMLDELTLQLQEGKINKYEYINKRNAWYKANTDLKTGKPVGTKFLNPPLKPHEQKFYDVWKKIYDQCLEMLPESAMRNGQIICMPKGSYESLKSMNSVNDLTRFLSNTLKNTFQNRLDQDVYNVENTVIGYDGTIMDCLPIYYNKLPYGETYDDMTSDAVASLAAFAMMANNFNRMDEILDALELGRDVIKNIQIQETKGDKPIKETLKYKGFQVINNVFKKSGAATNFLARMEDFFAIQIYGNRARSKHITIAGKEVSLNKLASNANMLTSLYTYALNLGAGISNLTTGVSMAFAEKMAGQYFNAKEMAKGDWHFVQSMPEYIGEVGKRIKTNKLSLFIEQFDVLQDFGTQIHDIDYIKKTRIGQLVDQNALYFLSNSGELFLQSRTALALAERYKLKDSSGNEISLWEALEVEYIDPNNHNKGAKLKIKDGYRNLDGSEFSRKDIIKFSEKSKYINQRMHGIYNREDEAAAQAYATGQLVFMFKKYFIPSMQRRFQKQNYSYALQDDTEGFYLTCGRFIGQLIKDVRNNEFDIRTRWDEMTETQHKNVIRALVEASLFFVLLAFVSMKDWGDDDDELKKNFAFKTFQYQAFRLVTELQAFVFNPLRPFDIVTANLKLFDNPAAALSLSTRFSYFLDALKVWNWGDWAEEDDILKSGKFKGHSKAYRGLWYGVPFYTTIYNGLHPWELVPWYSKDVK